MNNKIVTREVWLDIVKGVAILGCVFQHSLQRTVYYFDYGSDSIYSYLNSVVSRPDMCIFFLVSGYVYFKNRDKYIAEPSTFIKNRFMDLMLPYLFFSMLVGGGKILFSQFVKNQIGISALLDIFITPIAYLWFLYALFIIEVAVLLLDIVIKDRQWVKLLCLFFVFFYEQQHHGLNALQWSAYYIFWYYAAFVLLKFDLNQIHSNKMLLCGIFIVWLGLSLISFYTHSFWSIFSEMVLASMFVYGLLYKCSANKLVPRFLNYVGGITMYMYILNPIVINATRPLLHKIGIDSPIANLIMFIISAVIVSIAVAEVGKRVAVVDCVFNPRKHINKRK